MLQQELSRFDQLYLQTTDWPTLDFHRWENLYLSPLSIEVEFA